jgi:nucleotide-binding universal stress UspA family protein
MEILLATDGSAHSQAAIDLLKCISFPPGIKVTLLNIVERTSRFARCIQDEELEREFFDTLRREAEQLLAGEAGSLSDSQWQVQCVIREGHVADEICDAAMETGADLVIVGAGGQSGLTRFLLGSVSQKVMKYAPCSVLVVRPNSAEQEHATDKAENSVDLRILLAFDDSPTSQAAVKTLASLPLSDRAEVSVLTVITAITFYRMDIVEQMSEFWQEEKRAAEAALDATAERLKPAIPNVSTQLVESGNVSGAILDKAKEMDADLIIMGHKGTSAIDRFMLGSVSNRVVHHAPCSVWIVR